jgi:hypothetical protein
VSDPDAWLAEPDAASRPFFEGARDGKLVLQVCERCSAWQYPVRRRCIECGATALAWRAASGRGIVYAHGRLRRAYHPRHRERLPVLLATIDLEEGVRMSSNLVGVDPERVRAGMPVVVDFEPVPGGGAIPVFRPR